MTHRVLSGDHLILEKLFTFFVSSWSNVAFGLVAVISVLEHTVNTHYSSFKMFPSF